MEHKSNKELLQYAKELRKNMTKEEKHLWYDFLRFYKPKFLRQKIISRYILDFYCSEKSIGIEIDGYKHFTDEGKESDNERTAYLKQYGIEIIRIPNSEINRNFDGVCNYLDKIIKSK